MAAYVACALDYDANGSMTDQYTGSPASNNAFGTFAPGTAFVSSNVTSTVSYAFVTTGSTGTIVTDVNGGNYSAALAETTLPNGDILVAGYGAASAEVVDPTEVDVYRGGTNVNARMNVDVKIDKSTGLVKTTRGISVNTDPENPNIIRNGGPNKINSMPDELEIKNTSSSSGTHLEIVPKQPMTFEHYQQLLNLITFAE